MSKSTGLRRCLYIGLGGTGMNSLLHTKKMFIETYGEVPPMIGFLGIDTDGGAYTKTVESRYGDKVSLDGGEQCSIQCMDAEQIYLRNKESYFSWMAMENERAIESMTIGAGQVRTNGRLAVTVNYDTIKTALTNAINKITNADIKNDIHYKTLANNVEVHMVFSLCGGTGSGTFIDLAYIIKNSLPRGGKLVGYAVLPEVFESMMPNSPAMARVKPNAYGAIKDLDFFMHLTPSSHPIEFKYFTETYQIKSKPFNAIMLIDSKNKNNDTYGHINQLAEMISLSLIISAGELSVAAASVSDNVEKFISDGSMDIADKKAWITAVGACEILFRGEELAEIYAIKATQSIIQRLLNGCNDIDVIVNNWIDTIVSIRENNGRDDVIDYLLSKDPKALFPEVADPLNPKNEVRAYLASVLPKENAVKDKIGEKLALCKKTLDDLLKKYLNQECGITSCEDIILGIQAQIDDFQSEMINEHEELEKKIPQLKTNIDTLCSEMIDLAKRTIVFKRESKMKQLNEELSDFVFDLAKTNREIIRRNGAISLYNGIKNLLLDSHTHIQKVKAQVQSLYSELRNKLSSIQNRIGRNTETFQIDLAPEKAKTIVVDEDEIVIDDFVKSLNLRNKIFDFDKYDKEEIFAVFMEFTCKLPKAVKIQKTTIDEVINNLSDEDFDHLMDKAINKSLPLLTSDYKGYVRNMNLYKGFYIGVSDNKNNRIKENNNLERKVGATNLEFVPTGMPDRVIFYRQEGVIPAFALSSISEYKIKYESSSISHHIDENLLRRMQREEFSLLPAQEEDDSIELWVLGFIFKLIKVEDGHYYYKNKKEGQPLMDYWVDMGTTYRDDAFDVFKVHLGSIRKDFEKSISAHKNKVGSEVIVEFKEKVRSAYFDDFSGVILSKKELQKKENAAIASLINKELSLVENNLDGLF